MMQSYLTSSRGNIIGFPKPLYGLICGNNFFVNETKSGHLNKHLFIDILRI